LAVPSPRLLDALSGAGALVTDPDILASYRYDRAAPGLLSAGNPLVMVRPRSVEQVQAAVRAAGELAVPIVARGAGSGLSGGANAVEGCMMLSLEAMSNILEIDAEGLTATVQAGVINSTLRTAAADEGLLYAPDPASYEFSTIGGNVATNAGGLCCVKYGVTRDALLALQVVLADGRVIDLGHATRKNVEGYDLVSLMCGSEGTLGIVTAATVRLLPLPPAAHTLAASFPRLDDAGQAVAQICRRHRPSMLELMDRLTIRAVEELAPMELDLEAEAMLFASTDAGRLEGAEEIAAIAAICEQAGASIVVTSGEAEEGRALLAARRLAFVALERCGTTMLDDVAVPLPAIPALLRGIQAIGHEHDVLIATFGHAGDGNMHPTIVYDHSDLSAVSRARAAFDAILDLAGSRGGALTGEHGVGLLKRRAAQTVLADTLELQRAIKHAFDPHDLLNPGKGHT